MRSAISMKSIAVAVAALSLTACGGGSDGGASGGGASGGGNTPPPAAVDVRTLTVDATSHTEYVHINLHTGQIVEVAAQAETTPDWHIALRRLNVKLNGGTSGPANVAGALVKAQDDFYDNGTPIASRFSNATEDSEQPVLMADFDEPDASDWIRDSITTVLRGTSATDGGWYLYNPTDGTMFPNPDSGWLLRSGEGNSYARMRMTGLVFDTRSGKGVEHFRFEFDVQPSGVAQFTNQATFEGSLPPAGGEACFDFDTDQSVDCSGTAWDLKIGQMGRSFHLRSNGGVSGDGSGAAFGPFDWSELSTYASATMDPGGTSLTRLYTADSSSGVFSQHPWYAYNLAGQNRLWPNFRVYLIDTDRNDDTAARYAIQVTGYYNDAGISGHMRLRYRQVPPLQ